jgi:hypothetical protein
MPVQNIGLLPGFEGLQYTPKSAKTLLWVDFGHIAPEMQRQWIVDMVQFSTLGIFATRNALPKSVFFINSAGSGIKSAIISV